MDKDYDKNNIPVTNLVQDPILTIMNADQKQLFDNSIEKTQIIPHYKLNSTVDALFETRNYYVQTTDYVNVQTMVLELPIEVAIYSQINPSSQSFDFSKFAFADNFMLQILYQLKITLGNTDLHREECTLRRSLKSIINSGKSDNDINRIRGLIGLPYTQTVQPEQNPAKNIGWIQNDPVMRDALVTLLSSVSNTFNGTKDAYTTVIPTSGDRVDLAVYKAIVNLPLPLSLLSDLFDQPSHFPPGLNIHIYIRSYLQEQFIAFSPFSNYQQISVRLAGDPILMAEHDQLNPIVDNAIKQYRLDNNLVYNFSDHQEILLDSQGPSFNATISSQQQYPTEIIIRAVCTRPEPYTDNGRANTSNNALVYDYFTFCEFPDSITSFFNDPANPCQIRDLRLKCSGLLVYQFRQQGPNLKWGNITPGAQDYIFAYYNQKNSYVKKNDSIGKLKEPFKPINCTLFNSEIRFIFTPGGFVEAPAVNESLKNTTINESVNLQLELELTRPLPSNTKLVVLLRRPAQFIIDPLNNTKKVTWPDLLLDGQIYELNPAPAS